LTTRVAEMFNSTTLPSSGACMACKKRKTKCTRDAPCESCRRYGSPCIYDEASDQRRKVANIRNVSDLHWCRNLLSGVLAVIKAGHAQTRDQVLVDIQNTPSVIALSGRIEGVVHREPAVSQAFDQISEELQNHQRPEENQSRLLLSAPNPGSHRLIFVV